MEKDSDLNSLKSYPKFQEIAAIVKKRYKGLRNTDYELAGY
jgi:uncharacterized membrane protein YfbV (UPF0208 family)